MPNIVSQTSNIIINQLIVSFRIPIVIFEGTPWRFLALWMTNTSHTEQQ